MSRTQSVCKLQPPLPYIKTALSVSRHPIAAFASIYMQNCYRLRVGNWRGSGGDGAYQITGMDVKLNYTHRYTEMNMGNHYVK